jgi:hypothetical protein
VARGTDLEGAETDSDDERTRRHLAKVYTAQADGGERRVGSSFYRGDTANYAPRRGDVEKASTIADFILKGWMPDEPFIGPDTNIVAFGSCFAANIGRYLASLGFQVTTEREGTAYIQRIADGLVNVFAILQQFEWAWENRVPTVELWHGWKAEEYGYDEEVRLATKKLFDEADVFVLTFGLSEVWYDEPTGEVFWRAVPQDKFDAARHKFRVATIDETLTGLNRIRDLIREHRPDAKIIYTLSPIGLTATFRPVSCVTANAASKALLKACIDQLYREVRPIDANFYYFPSYEVVLAGFSEPFKDDLRHPHIHVLNCNMKAFERYFCTTGLTDEQLSEVIAEALKIDGFLQGATAEERKTIVAGAGDLWKEKKGLLDVEKQIQREKYVQERQRQVGEAVAQRTQIADGRLEERERRRQESAKRTAEREARRARLQSKRSP